MTGVLRLLVRHSDGFQKKIPVCNFHGFTVRRDHPTVREIDSSGNQAPTPDETTGAPRCLFQASSSRSSM